MEHITNIYSELLKNRIIFLGSEIDPEFANLVTAQLLYLSAEDPTKDIKIYINSPGGNVSAGLQILDTMDLIPCDIQTVCTGMAASMAAVILAAGTKGKRSALPHSKVLIHQPMGGASGQATDVLIAAEQIKKCRAELTGILSARTGQEESKVNADIERDMWMSSSEALSYGIIDSILTK